MTSVNGVHALLALLVQQSQSMKAQGKGIVDVKQLELLLQESQLLNERLLRIEKAVAALGPQDREKVSKAVVVPIRTEGNWFAASAVQDNINQQERQQAFGHWLAHETVSLDSEAFSHREIDSEKAIYGSEHQSLHPQKYTPTEAEFLTAHLSNNYGLNLRPSDNHDWTKLDDDTLSTSESTNRQILVAISISVFLLGLYIVFN